MAHLSWQVGLLTCFANYFPFFGLIGTLLPMPLLLLDPAVTGSARALAFLLPLAAHMLVRRAVPSSLLTPHSSPFHSSPSPCGERRGKPSRLTSGAKARSSSSHGPITRSPSLPRSHYHTDPFTRSPR